MQRTGAKRETTAASTSVSTHCPYCAFQCGMTLTRGHDGTLTTAGDAGFPVNAGRLCVKGFTSTELLAHPERLLTPLVRTRSGALAPASWESALDVIAARFAQTQAAHGNDAVGVFGSGALTNEAAYLLGKLARTALCTKHIDYNGRFCMSSAAAAAMRAFGIDRGLPFPLEDLARTDVIVLAGVNPAETMPPMLRYLEAQAERGGVVVVIDPRMSETAKSAALHLRLRPGTDAALANGLLHLLLREELVDTRYIEARTEGFAAVRAAAATYWPERVERITGVPEHELLRLARLLGTARSAVVLTGRGPEQQAQGVANALAYIHVALALGLVGKTASGFGCVTGQGNGQGGREHGQKADQLPGYRRIDDAAARAHVAGVWGVDPASLPGAGKSALEMLSTLGTPGGVRALFVMGSNLLVSAPNLARIEERLRALDTLVVVDFFLSETAERADVVLPAAMWAEQEGTMTNLEGRVLLRRRAVSPPADVRSDVEIIVSVARALGKGALFRETAPRAVFDELRRASAGGLADYAGITWEKIDAQQGVFWPCPTEDHPGTPRLFEHRFETPSGRARFVALEPLLATHEAPDAEYPLYLTTGRVLLHYQSGTQTRRVPRLAARASAPRAQVHPTTARLHALGPGDDVTLTTRRGSATFEVEVTSSIREDTVFVPFHWGGAQAVNRLTSDALDPISRMPAFKVCAVRLERSATRGERP